MERRENVLKMLGMELSGRGRHSVPRGAGDWSRSPGPGADPRPRCLSWLFQPVESKLQLKSHSRAQLHVALFVLEASIVNVCLSFSTRQNHRHQETGRRGEALVLPPLRRFSKLREVMPTEQMNE